MTLLCQCWLTVCKNRFVSISYSVNSLQGATTEHFWSERILVTSPGEVRVLHDSFTAHIECTLDRSLGRIVCSRVSVSRSNSGEITSLQLREVAVQTYVKAAADEMVEVLGRHGERQMLVAARGLFEPATGRSRNEIVADAALLYIIGTLTNRPPLKLVASHLKVSQSTATRLVSEARSQGLMPHG